MKKKQSNARGFAAVIGASLFSLLLIWWLNHGPSIATSPVPAAPGIKPVEPPTGVTIPSKPPIMIMNRPDTGEAIGSRLLVDDKPDARFGPGYDYPVVPGIKMQRGQRVFLVESEGMWVRVRLSEEPGPGAGWINKYSSMPEMHLSRDIPTFSTEVQHLKDIGLVIEVQTKENNVLVETNQWAQLTSDVRGGVGRSLAYYCGLKRGVNTRWVDLSDSVSGTRLARFSDNTGYSEYSTLRKPKK